jgi:hypothetical protein
VTDRESNQVQVFSAVGDLDGVWPDFYHPMDIWQDAIRNFVRRVCWMEVLSSSVTSLTVIIGPHPRVKALLDNGPMRVPNTIRTAAERTFKRCSRCSRDLYW